MQEEGEFVIDKKWHHEKFKILLSAMDKGVDFSKVMHVEREDDGRFVYVCTDGKRMHIFRTPDNFGFFKPDRNYTFKVMSKTVSFEETEWDKYPSWRKVVPENTRVIAKAFINRKHRTEYLAGFYRAGIYIGSDHLACLETDTSPDYTVHAGDDLSRAIIIKNESRNFFDFDAVIMPLQRVATDAFVAQKED